MARKHGTIDIDTGFKFIFKDKAWVRKAAAGALLSLTVIGIFAVYGWALEVQRRVIKSGKAELPEWDNLGDYFISGFKYWVIQLIALSPYLFLFCLISAPPSDSLSQEWVDSTVFFFQLAGGVWGVVVYIQLPVLSGLFIETNLISTALSFRKFTKIYKANWRQFLGVGFLSYVATFAANLAGAALFCIGILFTTPLALAVIHHLYGQAFRNAKLSFKKRSF